MHKKYGFRASQAVGFALTKNLASYIDFTTSFQDENYKI